MRELVSVRLAFGWPFAEPRDDVVVQRIGQAELRMYRRAADSGCVGIMHIRIAASAGAHRDIFQPVPRHYVGECRREQRRRLARDFGECLFERGECCMRLEVAHHQHIRRQAMLARIAARRHSRRVRARYRRKRRMVIVERHAFGDERRQIGRQRGRNLRGLQAVERDHQDVSGIISHRLPHCSSSGSCHVRPC